MGLLDKYKKIAKETEDNEFPQDMEHDGLTENDRQLYEQVLKNMRDEMDKANDNLKNHSSSWGGICKEVNGSIENNTYKMSDNMIRAKNTTVSGNKMRVVSEPIGLMIETFRCPRCGKLMYEEKDTFKCPNCDYEEASDTHLRFVLVDSTYTKTPLPNEYNDLLCNIFNEANKKTKK